jgi:hypothetical protein
MITVRQRKARTPKLHPNEPAASFIHPKRRVNSTAPMLARKLINPTRPPIESGDVAREASWKMAPKFMEANQAARTAMARTSHGEEMKQRGRKMTKSAKTLPDLGQDRRKPRAQGDQRAVREGVKHA